MVLLINTILLLSFTTTYTMIFIFMFLQYKTFHSISSRKPTNYSLFCRQFDLLLFGGSIVVAPHFVLLLAMVPEDIKRELFQRIKAFITEKSDMAS